MSEIIAKHQIYSQRSRPSFFLFALGAANSLMKTSLFFFFSSFNTFCQTSTLDHTFFCLYRHRRRGSVGSTERKANT